MAGNPFISIRVFPNFATGHIVQWALDPVFNEDGPYIFTLEASETPAFTQLIFSKCVGGSYFAIDDTHIKQNLTDSYIYRIKLQTADNLYYSRNANYSSDIQDRNKYLMAAEMTRKEFVRFKYTGRPGWLLKRKGYGTISTQTVDPVSGVPLTDNPIDYGTGLAGGYHEPLQILYSREANTEDKNFNQGGLGINDSTKMKIRMVGFPMVDHKDIIVTIDDERYTFEKVDRTTFPGTDVTIIQNGDMLRIATTDSIYKIKMPTLQA